MLERDAVIPTLLAEFPDFANLADIEEGPYVILGEFALYLRDGITDGTFENDELDNAFSFLNAMGASGDIEIENQLVVGILEILTDTDQSILVTKENLKNRALKLFERTLSGWIPDPNQS